jgi:ABC-type polar amino acid transport system ATPase subunit
MRLKSAGWSQGLLYVGLVFAVSVTHLVFQQMTYFRAQRVLMNVCTAHTARHTHTHYRTRRHACMRVGIPLT